jgi:predicted DNA-binding protein
MNKTSIRLPDKLRDALEALARSESRTFGAYVRMILQKHVEKEWKKK